MDINYSLLLSIFYVKTRDFVNEKFFIIFLSENLYI
jgi:hypothetical protein